MPGSIDPCMIGKEIQRHELATPLSDCGLIVSQWGLRRELLRKRVPVHRPDRAIDIAFSRPRDQEGLRGSQEFRRGRPRSDRRRDNPQTAAARPSTGKGEHVERRGETRLPRMRDGPPVLSTFRVCLRKIADGARIKALARRSLHGAITEFRMELKIARQDEAGLMRDVGDFQYVQVRQVRVVTVPSAPRGRVRSVRTSASPNGPRPQTG